MAEIFDILTAKNKNNTGIYHQLWGVQMSGLTQVGCQWSFGVAVNENFLVTVVLTDDHPFLSRLIESKEDCIGNYRHIYRKVDVII